ncbi:MAG: nitroreductase family protein, partial [Lachnospiraceae bacterium]|nr:nitroreductase family protein [Lachnospiraceae bacterium]
MLYDLVVKNRSYRGYDHSVKLTRQQLERYVEHARLCASSVNRQPFKYFLACDEETVAVIQAQTGWARALPQMKLPHPGKEPSAFIVICQDDTLDANLNRYQKDVGIVAQTMLLAAVEEGLGGIMIGNFSPAKISEALSLPPHIVPLLIVAFGKPDETVVL